MQQLNLSIMDKKVDGSGWKASRLRNLHCCQGAAEVSTNGEVTGGTPVRQRMQQRFCRSPQAPSALRDC